jgi:hypothetical protein
MVTHPQLHKHLTPAQCLVLAFCGVRAAGRAVKRTPSTVRNMIRKGYVPHEAQVTALLLAREKGLNLTAEDLILGRDVKGDQ